MFLHHVLPGNKSMEQLKGQWGSDPLALLLLNTSVKSWYCVGMSTFTWVSGLLMEVNDTVSVSHWMQCFIQYSDHAVVSCFVQNIWRLCVCTQGNQSMMGFVASREISSECRELIVRIMVPVIQEINLCPIGLPLIAWIVTRLLILYRGICQQNQNQSGLWTQKVDLSSISELVA